MSPGIGVVSNICQIDIAVAVFLVHSDVLPVAAGCSLQLNVSQPSTWSGRKVRLDEEVSSAKVQLYVRLTLTVL